MTKTFQAGGSGSDVGSNTICVLEEKEIEYVDHGNRGEERCTGVMLGIKPGSFDCQAIALVSRLFAFPFFYMIL